MILLKLIYCIKRRTQSNLFFGVVLTLFLFGYNTVANEPITYADFVGKQDCFNTSDGRMAYIDEGVGEPIVLLHGVPTSGWLFRKMIDPLVEAGYRVIVPDMLGFGNSDNPIGASVYSPANHAKRLLELMHKLNIKSWTHVMHDAGGIWTAELLDQSPNSIQQLVAINAVIDGYTANWKGRFDMGVASEIGLKMKQVGLRKRSFMTRFILKNSALERPSKEALLGYEAPIQTGKMNGIYGYYANMIDNLEDSRRRRTKFDGKILVLWGKNDAFIPWETQEGKAKEMFDLKVENIHLIDGGHLIPQESHAFLDSMIINFIDSR